MKSVISSQQLPHCSVCNLQPVPESTQHILFLIGQIGLLFINFKLSLIFLMLGYSFPLTVWKCPFCSRQVEQVSKNNNIQNNIIIRLGNCMALFSLNKFRIFAVIVAIICAYFYVIQPPNLQPKVKIQNTWQSLVQNCGFQAYIENSFRANHLYTLYSQSSKMWQLQPIYLSHSPSKYADYQYIDVKMDPTQFKDQQALDFRIFIKSSKLKLLGQLKKGDVFKTKGQFQSKQQFAMIFIPTEIVKTNESKNIKNIKYFYQKNSMLRSHLQSVKGIYQSKDDALKNKQKQQSKLKTQSKQNN